VEVWQTSDLGRLRLYEEKRKKERKKDRKKDRKKERKKERKQEDITSVSMKI